MAETFLLKNILNPQLTQVLGQRIKLIQPDFDLYGFVEFVVKDLEPLALKERSKLIARGLYEFLPSDYEESILTLISAMQTPLTEADNLGRYKEFFYMPFGEFISQYGQEYFHESMLANYELTKVFTAEFSIRIFIEKYPKDALALLHQWAMDENYHVRRLVSEGTRPRLPWASRLPEFQRNPEPVLELLEKLKNDPELYVRRSVANNLNDIAKDHPDLVVERLFEWKNESNENTNWIVKHASRSLIKSGHPEALLLQGFNPSVKVEVKNLVLNGVVHFGDYLEFDFDLINEEGRDELVVVDFVIYFKKASGKLAPKVFKLTEKKLKAKETLHLSRRHPIKAISTRKYYNGEQKLAIQINGNESISVPFELRGAG